MEGSRKQVALMLRSYATVPCEPCQDRNIAALSGTRRVP